jgi:hypothetical protein
MRETIVMVMMMIIIIIFVIIFFSVIMMKKVSVGVGLHVAGDLVFLLGCQHLGKDIIIIIIITITIIITSSRSIIPTCPITMDGPRTSSSPSQWTDLGHHHHHHNGRTSNITTIIIIIIIIIIDQLTSRAAAKRTIWATAFRGSAVVDV